jgi:hypothetical protein
MGKIKPDALRDALANCDSRSPQHFRRAVESWQDPYYSESFSSRDENTDQDQHPEPKAPIQTVEPGESQQSAEPENAVLEEQIGRRVDTRSPLVRNCGVDTATKVFSIWTDRITQQGFNTLSKSKQGQKVIRRAVRMAEELGVVQNALSVTKPSHLLFVPELPHGRPPANSWTSECGVEWGSPKQVNKILDQIPDARRMIIELGEGRTLNDYRAWWNTRNVVSQQTDEAQSKTTGVDMSAFEQPDEHVYSVEPARGAESQPIVVHGQTIWPNDSALYSFEEAWAAFHFWQDEDCALSLGDASPSSRGRHFMTMAKWLEYVSTGFARAVHRIATAQHHHPDKADQTQAPGKHFRTN